MGIRKENLFPPHSKSIYARIRRVKIQKRLALSFAILSLVPLFITGWFAYDRSSVVIKNKISTYSIQVMNQVSINIRNDLAKLENDSVDIAFSDIVQNTLLSYEKLDDWEKKSAELEMSSLLAKRYSFVPSVTDIQVFTKNTEKINAYGDDNFRFRLNSEFTEHLLENALSRGGVPLWTIQGKEHEEDWQDFNYRTNVYGEYGILLARSFRSLKEGSTLGYIMLRIDEAYILNKYKEIDLGEGSDIFILNEQGQVISSRTPELVTASMYDDPSFIQQLSSYKDKEIYSFINTISGKPYLTTYSFIPHANWYLISTIPFSYLNYESVQIGIYIAGLGIICSILALLVSYLISRSISKPLYALVASMNQVKVGHFPTLIRDKSQDELGVVTEHFNKMVEDLKFLINELKRKEKLKRLAELKALQAQINPHFLSNTLNTISWLAKVQKADNISNVINDFIELLRASMGKGGEFATIKEEVEYVKNYLNIMAYKYYDKFSVHYEVEEEVLHYQTLKFLLQPIVENAVLHGIEPMKGHGHIVIKAYKIEEDLKISITDNGVGINAEEMSKLMQKKQDVQQTGGSGDRLSGIGIWNVDQRIKLSFGEDYGISILSVPELYTTIEIAIPIVTEEEKPV
jgi:two-component system sensor histidine kinase YesM